MKIQVTEQDIQAGKPCNPGYCPVARAVARAFNCPLVEIAIEYNGTGNLNIIYGFAYIRLPKIVYEFVRHYDLGRSLQPFEFELDYEIPHQNPKG